MNETIVKPIDTEARTKNRWPVAAVLFVMVLSVAVYAGQVQANNESIYFLIQKAGNSDSDNARLAYLKQLRNRPELDKSLKADVDKLIFQIDRWLGEKRLDYFGREAKKSRFFMPLKRAQVTLVMRAIFHSTRCVG